MPQFAYYGLWCASIGAEAVFLLILAKTRLAARHRALTGWIVLDIVSSIVEMFLTDQPQLYLRVFIASSAAIIGFQFFAVRDVFAGRIAQYPGIGYFGKKLLLGTMAFGAVVSVLVINSDWVHAETTGDRSMAACRIFFAAFTLFLLGAMAFFTRFHVPTPQNAIALERGALVYFASQAIPYFFLVKLGNDHLTNTINSATTLLGTIVTFGYWIYSIRPSREFLPAQPDYDPVEHARIEALNAEGLRFAKSVRGVAWRR